MTFHLLARRIHLYLGLFLAPWVLLYGISVLAMNHMPFFQDLYGPRWGQFAAEKQLTWESPLPAGTAADEVGRRILRDLGMDGAHNVQARRDGTIIVHRHDVVTPRRITYRPTDRLLVVERQELQLPLLLRRLHAQRGYGQPYLANDAWAVCVDLFIAAVLLWGITGVWIWLKIRPARRWGAVCAAAGCVVLVFFLATI